jgi:hypothetical protein
LTSLKERIHSTNLSTVLDGVGRADNQLVRVRQQFVQPHERLDCFLPQLAQQPAFDCSILCRLVAQVLLGKPINITTVIQWIIQTSVIQNPL